MEFDTEDQVLLTLFIYVLQSDLQALASRIRTLGNVRFRDLLGSTPIPDHLKIQLVNTLKTFTHPTLSDPIIHMMLVMIVMFNDIRSISDQCWTMLTRWVKRMVGDHEDSVKNILQLQGCLVEMLPVMTRLQAELL